MKIYTKTGDDGTTGLFNGQRVLKSSARVNLYGTVDEVNSIVGLANSMMPKSSETDQLTKDLSIISHRLFDLGSDLASPRKPAPKFEVPRIGDDDIIWLENKIDEYDEQLDRLKVFILPGGSQRSAFLHQARTVCRRAERLAVELSADEDLGEFAIKYLNRLSDYFFAASRFANKLEGFDDIAWEK